MLKQYGKYFLPSHSLMNPFKLFSAKIIKVNLDENNQQKVEYLDYDQYLNQNKPKDKISNKTLPRIKIYGSETVDETSTQTISYPKEECKENLLKYDQFFSDFCRVYVKAGDGGNGLFSVLKGTMYDQITPQGGNGGKGGNIILKADKDVSSLSSLRRAHLIGNNGMRGGIKAQAGGNGKDVEYLLPVGTIIKEIIREDDYQFKKRELRSDKGYQTKFIADLDEHGKKIVIAQGGKGGIGNFTKRNLERGAPLLKGIPGEEKELELIYKCSADLGFIGFPNAGKSTLLAALTRVMPKISSYPFTTLHPHLGRLKFEDQTELTVADLPGLIEGSHINKGFGNNFLKHVERVKIVLFVLDGSTHPDSKRSPHSDMKILLEELKKYDEKYLDKPFIIALNKCDTDEAIYNKNYELLINSEIINKREVLKISGREGYGLPELVMKVKHLADKLK